MEREASAPSKCKLLGNGGNFGYQAYDASIEGGALLLFWLRALLRQHGTESRIYPGPRPFNELGRTQRRGAHTALPMGFFGNVGRTNQLFVYVRFKLLFITYLYTPFDSELNSELKILATRTTTSFFCKSLSLRGNFLKPGTPPTPFHTL